MTYQEHIENMLKLRTFSVGDDVMVLIDYSLRAGKIVKVNPKGLKVCVVDELWSPSYVSNFKYEKVLQKGQKVVLVWEGWKGVNGRGGYRLETIMYTELAKNVEAIRPSHYLREEDFGFVTVLSKQQYLHR